MTANDLRKARAQNSPMLAVDPTDSRFVALANRLDAPDFGCALQISGNGGRGWTTTNPVAQLPSGAEKCYAPEVVFGADGTLLYLFLGLAGRGNSPMGVYLTKSGDRARTFSTPRRVLGPGNYQVRMALDPTMGESGRIHLIWLRTGADAPLGGLPPPPNPILASYSDDGGESFSKPVRVSDPNRDLSVAPAVAVGRDHALHVAYYDLRGDRRDYQGLSGPRWAGRWSLVSTTSRDGGKRFERGVVVDDGLVPPERVMLIYTMPPPSLAAADGRVFAAWHDARNGDWDVFLRRSDDAGRSWDGRRRLSDERPSSARHQYLPRLSVAPNNRIDAIFYDRREDPENLRNHVYYTYSTDAGRSFSQNVRLSSAASDSRAGQRYLVPSARGKVEFGARVALLSRSGSALAAWTDTRNAPSPLPQDIFAAQAVFSNAAPTAPSRRPSSIRLPPGALLALVILGSTGVVIIHSRRRPRSRERAS